MRDFPYKKVLITGCPGSGKSTFARKLRDAAGLPLYYLDMLFHRPDRSTATREEFDEALKNVLSEDEWIIDGNYLRTLPVRLKACEAVFYFDISPELCIQGAASRIGTVREDMPWVEQSFDPEFRQYILDFQKDQRPVISELFAAFCTEDPKSPKLITFTSRSQADDYIDSLEG